MPTAPPQLGGPSLSTAGAPARARRSQLDRVDAMDAKLTGTPIPLGFHGSFFRIISRKQRP